MVYLGAVFCTLRLENALFIEQEGPRREKSLIAVVQIILLTAIGAAFVLGACYTLGSEILPDMSKQLLSILIPASALLGLNSVAQAFVVSNGSYDLVNKFRVLQAVSVCLIQILFVSQSPSAMSMASGFLVGQAICLCYVFRLLKPLILRQGEYMSSWTRIDDNMMPPRVKAGANYINSRYGFLQAQQDGYDLPIFLDRNGKVSESSGSCLFMVREGTLVTPPLSSSVLESITRACIFELAADANLRILERQIDRTELYISDEVFLCGSAVEISPLVSIDQYEIGDATPGPISTLLLEKYLNVASGLDDQRFDWLRPISIC